MRGETLQRRGDAADRRENIELYECKGITDAGLGFLASLPNLRKLSLAGLPNVTLAGTAVFPPRIRVEYSVQG